MEALDDTRVVDYRMNSNYHLVYPRAPNRTTSPGAHCYIDELPEEILVMVFSFILLEDRYSLPKPQRTTLMLVCKLWTRVVAESPSFWTAIRWTGGQQEWEQSLGHSKGLPFAIDCTTTQSPLSLHFRRQTISLLDWLIRKPVRIRRFRFAHGADVKTWATVWKVLSLTNLDLQEIELSSLGWDTRFQPSQGKTFLGKHVQKLQSVSLYCVIIPWQLYAVPTLRSLSIAFPYHRPGNRDPTCLPTHAEILSIMDASPLLETVHIRGIYEHRPPSSTTFPRIAPKHLKELNVEGMPSRVFCDLVEGLNLPKTTKAIFVIRGPLWPQADSDAEAEFAKLVSGLAGDGLLQDCDLEFQETSLRATNSYRRVRLFRENTNIDYKRMFRELSKHARSNVVSARISSMYCDDSRELLEAIHTTFPNIGLLRFSMYRLGNGFGGWPGVLEDRRRPNNSKLPKSLFSRLTAIEVDIDTMVDLDLSGILTFICARNSQNRAEEDKARPNKILRLRITAPLARLPAAQEIIWKGIQTLVASCHWEATEWMDEEEEMDSLEEP